MEYVHHKIKDYEKVYNNITSQLKKYIIENNIKSLVIGISGGIDSTVCALLAREVSHELELGVTGINLPIKIEWLNKQRSWEMSDKIETESNTVAKEIGENFCDIFRVDDLSYPFNIMWHSITRGTKPEFEPDIKYKIRRGNAMARSRMIYLYNLAQQYDGMVLSTDNFTEYLLGFWTLHGDVGDYGMIQNLWKTEVYELAKWIAENIYLEDQEKYFAIYKSIHKTPTDGLGITNSDFEQIGKKSYNEVDSVLINYLTGETIIDKSGVIHRHLGSEFKRLNPINLERDKIIF